MANKTSKDKSERRYWLWVADSRAWLEKDGQDARDLDPKNEPGPGELWTCNKGAKEGDLAFLWRTKRGTGQKSDIGYLIEVKSDAFVPPKFKNSSWKYWCKFKSLYKFENPATIDDFKGAPCLENWGVYRAHFQLRAYEIPKEQWEMLNKIAAQRNPDYGDFIQRILEQFPVEKVDQRDTEIQKEKVEQVATSTNKKSENIDEPPIIPDSLPLNIDDFRLSEELPIYGKIKDHPGVKKLQMLFPEFFQQEIQPPNMLSLKNLIKEGARITRSSRNDIIETIENSFRMFGAKNQSFDVFAQKDLSESENATVFVENDLPVFVFIHDILRTFSLDEIKAVIGHESGHYLLGHTTARIGLLPIWMSLNKAKEIGALINHDDLKDLFFYFQLLPQIQELSADRIGLLVSQKFQSSITGLVKLSGGYIGENININDYIEQGKEVKLEPDDIDETHPLGPKRSLALQFFSETELYNKAIGKPGGKSISDFSKLLPEIIPFPEDETTKEVPRTSSETPLRIQDYILELFFYNDIAWVDGKFSPAEIKVVTRFIPLTLRDEVFQTWNDLTKDWDVKSEEYIDKVAKQYITEASQMDSHWKMTLIKRMIKVAKASRRNLEEKLDQVAAISDKINAQKECSRQFLKEFGYDPFATEQA
jgi:hypothetical protein